MYNYKWLIIILVKNVIIRVIIIYLVMKVIVIEMVLNNLNFGYIVRKKLVILRWLKLICFNIVYVNFLSIVVYYM